MLLCKDKVKWQASERKEMNSIEENEVWMKTSVPTGTKVIPLKWVYKLKKDRLGNIVRHKCRLVAQGFFQVFGQDSQSSSKVYVDSHATCYQCTTRTTGTPDGCGYHFS